MSAAGSRRATNRQIVQSSGRGEGEPEDRRPDHEDVAHELLAGRVGEPLRVPEQDRPAVHQPRPRPRLPRVRRGQAVVEGQPLRVLVPQRPQRARDEREVGLGVLLGPRLALGGLTQEPAGEAREVGEHRDDGQRPHRAREPAPQRGAGGPGHPRLAPRGAVPEQRQDREERQEPDAAPLHRAGAAEEDAGGDPPAARPEPETRRGPGRPDALAHRVAVDHETGDGAEHEHLQEDVEQADPREREGEPVEGEQQAGQEAEQGRPRQPPGQSHEDDDRDGPGHRAREPPAQRVVAEQLLAGRDQPLAQWRVDDEGVAAVVLEAPGEELVRLGRVVGLVEEPVGRVADVPEPAEQAGDAEDRGEDPGQSPVPGEGRGAVAPGAGERPAARGGRRQGRLRLLLCPLGRQHRHAARVGGTAVRSAVTGSVTWSDSWCSVARPSGNPATWGPGCAR